MSRKTSQAGNQTKVQPQSKMMQELGYREISINGHRFEVNLLPCGPAGEVFVDLMDIAGPSIGVVVDKLRNQDYLDPADDTTFAEIITTITSRLARGDFNRILDSLLDGCVIDGQQFNKDEHLRGEFSTYVKLIKFSLEVNFTDFFTEFLKDMGLEIPSLSAFVAKVKQVMEENQRVETQSEE